MASAMDVSRPISFGPLAGFSNCNVSISDRSLSLSHLRRGRAWVAGNAFDGLRRSQRSCPRLLQLDDVRRRGLDYAFSGVPPTNQAQHASHRDSCAGHRPCAGPLSMPNDKLAHPVLDRRRRQPGANGATNVMHDKRLQLAQLLEHEGIKSSLGLAETRDRLCTEGGREQVIALIEPRERFKDLIAIALKGTSCAASAFMRSAGMVQIFSQVELVPPRVAHLTLALASDGEQPIYRREWVGHAFRLGRFPEGLQLGIGSTRRREVLPTPITSFGFNRSQGECSRP